jgi:hypothetical protein
VNVNNDYRLDPAIVGNAVELGFDEAESDVRKAQATYCFNDHLETVQ